MAEPVAAAIYVREVPGLPTTPDDQRAMLEQAAAARGWRVVERASDPPRPYGPTRDRRPEFQRLLREAEAGRVSVLVVAGVDVVARSMPDLTRTLGLLREAGGRLYIDWEGIDTGEPEGAVRVMEAFGAASLERRSRAASEGMQRAKAAGHRIGAAKVSPDREERVRQLRAEGLGIRRVAAIAGVGVSTVQRIDAEMRQHLST